MSDNLKVAKECGFEETGFGAGDSEIFVYTKPNLEAYTSRILASQQAAHEAEIERLRAQVAMLHQALHDLGAHSWECVNTKGKCVCGLDSALANTQATAEQFIAECEQRGAVKALKKFRSDYRLEKIYPSEFLNEAIERAEGELRAPSKKAG